MPSSGPGKLWPLAVGDRTRVMAVINLTPDSFSGDGFGPDPEAAVRYIRLAVADGADIVDVGGESSRPAAVPVSADEELARILPTLDIIAGRTSVPISVDTRKAVVADAALARGVDLINDVSGLADPEMARTVAASGAGVVLVHGERPDPGIDVVDFVQRGLERLIERALRAGVGQGRIVVDPGLGFGKRWRANLEIIHRLRELGGLGFPLLVGPSRKGTIGKVLGLPPDQRLEGTAALITSCIAGGADIVRVHDVREMVRVSRMADALVRSQVTDSA